MLAFPGMLVNAAKEVGMKVPDDPDSYEQLEDFRSEFPHFYVFCQVQLNRHIDWFGEVEENAQVISELTDQEVMQVNLQDLIERGLRYGQ